MPAILPRYFSCIEHLLQWRKSFINLEKKNITWNIENCPTSFNFCKSEGELGTLISLWLSLLFLAHKFFICFCFNPKMFRLRCWNGYLHSFKFCTPMSIPVKTKFISSLFADRTSVFQFFHLYSIAMLKNNNKTIIAYGILYCFVSNKSSQKDRQ